MAFLRARGFISTWYVRRGRRRFWKSANDQDKWAAYQTLHEVLVGLARLLAPVMPFLSEELYQNLVRSVDDSAPTSVHLTRYPEVQVSARDETLERSVELARSVVALGRAAREKASIKVRQPLPGLLVRLSDGGDLESDLVAEIADELNVKHVQFVAVFDKAVEYVATPRPELLGPKYGKRYPAILKALRSGQFSVAADGAVHVDGVALEPAEVVVSTRGIDGFQVAEDASALVALDTAISEELRREGLAREVVRRLQELRKDAGLNLEDRIEVGYQIQAPDADLESVFAEHRDYVSHETLALSLRPSLESDMACWSGELEGHALTLGLRRARS